MHTRTKFHRAVPRRRAGNSSLARALFAMALGSSALAFAPHDANADTEETKPKGVMPVDLDVSYQLFGSDTVSLRGWRGYSGYARKLGRSGNWASFYGGGLVVGKNRVTDKATVSVEYQSFGGAQARFGGAYMRGSVKLVQGHLFASTVFAEDAIEDGGLVMRIGATASWNTVGKFLIIGNLLTEDDDDHDSGQSDKGLGVAMGLVGAIAIVAAPTHVSLFVEDSPGNDIPARYGVSFGWSL